LPTTRDRHPSLCSNRPRQNLSLNSGRRTGGFGSADYRRPQVCEHVSCRNTGRRARSYLIRFGQYTGGDYVWPWKGNSREGASIDAELALYPLPASELRANPNLEQNPGY
jgi:hypothetical protein